MTKGNASLAVKKRLFERCIIFFHNLPNLWNRGPTYEKENTKYLTNLFFSPSYDSIFNICMDNITIPTKVSISYNL